MSYWLQVAIIAGVVAYVCVVLEVRARRITRNIDACMRSDPVEYVRRNRGQGM